jgi:IS5 family transposase
MDWTSIEKSYSAHFASHTGRPALPPMLVAGLLYLQHAYDCSDEVAVNAWVENPYWQHFTGETYFQTEAPIDPSSLTRWRKRVGEEGVETMLMATIEAGRKLGLLKRTSVDRVIVDTTVMPKAIAHPTDSRLLEKSRQHLVALAQEEGLSLRQNYNREAPRLAAQIGRYAHAKQYRRMKKSLRTLRSRVGRVMRDVGRQIERIDPSRQNTARDILSKANRILTQKTHDKNKLYAFHAPEVECIAKGKARTPYEFGVKVTVATTLKEGFVVGMRSMPGNPPPVRRAHAGRDDRAGEHPGRADPDDGDRRPGLPRRGGRRRPDPALGTEEWHHQDAARDDQAAQRHRADNRTHENRRPTCP